MPWLISSWSKLNRMPFFATRFSSFSLGTSMLREINCGDSSHAWLGVSGRSSRLEFLTASVRGVGLAFVRTVSFLNSAARRLISST